MTSIDTIKFSLSFPSNYFNKLNLTDRLFKTHLIKFERNPGTRVSITISHKRCGSTDLNYIHIYVNNNQETLSCDFFITIHLNMFNYFTFSEDYINKEDIFNEISSLIKEILFIENFDDQQLSIAEIDVSLDLELTHPIRHYLKLLEFKNCNYYSPILNTGNRTITIHKSKDLENLSFDSKKAEKVATVYDKSKKLRQQEYDIGDSNLLRFEYSFSGKHRRDLGIIKNQFNLSKIYDIHWKECLDKYLFDKYLEDYTKMEYRDLFGRQDSQQEKKYPEHLDPRRNYLTKRKAENIFRGSDRKFSYKVKRYYAVNFKRHLKEQNVKIGVTGLDLYNEMYSKVKELEQPISDQVPNVYRLYEKN